MWLKFVFFILCVIILLWVFQVFFLENFYENIKSKSTLENVQKMAEMIEEADSSDSFDELMKETDSKASANDISYMVMSFNGRSLRLIHENDSNISDQIPQNTIQSLWSHAVSKGDTACSISEIGNNRFMTVCTIISHSNSINGCIIAYSNVAPGSAVISLLKRNTYIITAILLVISLFISIITSRSIGKPISTITNSAERLAKGEYNTHFDGGKFSETRQLAKTLNYASAEISKIDELQRDLIANVSHDLRTPLTMIKAYAEMIRDLSGERKDKREEHLKIIIDETDRLALLVNDMLDLSKLENGSQTLNYSTFDINSKLKDIIERYKGLSNVSGYSIHFDNSERAIVKCDMVKIEQVLYNLINNAINYTGDDKQVFIEQSVDNEFVKISIRDTGKGISEENMHQIFDKYYRCEKTKREVVGTGLGLSIVKAILKKHNFPFGVQSTIGVGTTFWFKVKRDVETICITSDKNE